MSRYGRDELGRIKDEYPGSPGESWSLQRICGGQHQWADDGRGEGLEGGSE